MRRQGKANFGDAGVFIEKYVQRARHIEVQMFGDGEGNVVTFVERECSIQRRHQKIVEETPSPYVGGLPFVSCLFLHYFCKSFTFAGALNGQSFVVKLLFFWHHSRALQQRLAIAANFLAALM